MVAILPANPQSLRAAQFIATQFGQALSDSSSSAQSTPCRGGPGLLQCTGISSAWPVRVLVLVCDCRPIGDPTGAVRRWQHKLHVEPGYEFLPVCPAGLAPAVQAQLPAPLDEIKIREFTRTPAEITPDIFRTAGLISDDYRVFISYRQDDGRHHADRLFGALTRRGFDVFLDRARIAVGRSIPRRIQEELAHKSVLLVLETPNARRSTWVRQEVGIAIANRIGILAVHFPGGAKLGFLSDRRRHSLQPGDLRCVGSLNTLTGEALDQICDRVAQVQDFTLVRRRYQMSRALSKALLYPTQGGPAPITNQRITPKGCLDVVPNWTPTAVCSVRLTPRLPEIDDFRRLDQSRAPARSYRQAVIARGATSFGRRQDDIRRIADSMETPWYDEAEIPILAGKLRSATGSLKK
jgi:TIR domain